MIEEINRNESGTPPLLFARNEWEDPWDLMFYLCRGDEVIGTLKPAFKASHHPKAHIIRKQLVVQTLP